MGSFFTLRSLRLPVPGSMQVYNAYFYPFTYNHRRSRQLYPVLLLPAGLSGSVMPNGSHSPQVPCALHLCGAQWMKLPCITFQSYWKLLSDEQGEQQSLIYVLCTIWYRVWVIFRGFFFSFFTLSMLSFISPSHTSNFSQSLFKGGLRFSYPHWGSSFSLVHFLEM